eukprot:gene17534-65613_t
MPGRGRGAGRPAGGGAGAAAAAGGGGGGGAAGRGAGGRGAAAAAAKPNAKNAAPQAAAPPAAAKRAAGGRQRQITEAMGSPPGVDINQPLRHPSFVAEAERWKHFERTDIVAIKGVTKADSRDPQARVGPMKHGRGWTAYNEDLLEWKVVLKQGCPCNHTPTMMLWGLGLVDRFLTHDADEEELQTVRRGAPQARWCMEPMDPLREQARAAAARKYPGTSANVLHADDQRLAEELVGHVREPAIREDLRRLQWHVVLDIFANECLPRKPTARRGEAPAPAAGGVARIDTRTTAAIEDAAIRLLARRHLPGRVLFLERDRKPREDKSDGSCTYDWEPPAPPEPAAGGPGPPAGVPLPLRKGGRGNKPLPHPLVLLDALRPELRECPPGRRYESVEEMEAAMLLPGDALLDAPLHERPWDRWEQIDDDEHAEPGPDWAHIDAAAEAEDPYHLRDPPTEAQARAAGAAAAAAAPPPEPPAELAAPAAAAAEQAHPPRRAATEHIAHSTGVEMDNLFGPGAW